MRTIPNNGPEGVPVPPPLPDRYFQDERWLSDHLGELQERYPHQWVAVVNGRAVAVGEVLAEVERLAEERTGAREFPVWFVQGESGYHSHWRIL